MAQSGFDVRLINLRIIDEFRANQGNLSGPLKEAPMLLLTTKGRKSGREHTTPLGYGKEGDCHYVLAMNAGAPRNPDWYWNLVANPEVTVEVGTQKYRAKAVVANDREAEPLITNWANQTPAFQARIAALRATTTRKVPVVLLQRL